jgi:hypothetical protein
MQSVHQFLCGVLQRLARIQGDLSIGDAVPFLCAALDVRDVRFLDENGQDLGRGMRLRDLIAAPFEVVLHDRVSIPLRSGAHPGPASVDDGEPARSRFHATDAPPPPVDDNRRLEMFIREFNRLQHRNEFMWAGYVVREMLPRIGYDPDDTKSVLNKLRADRIVNVKKVPNPRNPEFPATGVQLNLSHPLVRSVLGLPQDEAQDESADGESLADSGLSQER